MGLSRMRLFPIPGLLAAIMLLAACGGGGGSNGPPPTPPNRAPTFTSPAVISVAENSAGTIYTATASDADGNPISFSLSGGADQGAFLITGSGALSFALPPDFEAPADADQNNIYLVRIGASDGQTSTILDLSITITNSGSDSFRVSRVGVGFNQPLYLTALRDGTGRLLVVEKIGRIRILNPATGAIAAAPFLDISASISTDGERGLLGLALAPNFETSGDFYVYLTNPGGDIEVRFYRAPATNSGTRDQADPASGDVIMTIPHPGFSNHNGGWVDFGNDGFLYLATGDGGGGGDPNNNSQNVNSLLGKLLRIDVSRDDFPADTLRDYAIPAGNPFGQANGRPEIFALGLRNPFRAGFDRSNGNLYVGDVGQSAMEEIDLLRPGDGGANFGWPFREGSRDFRGGGPASLVPPVAEYAAGSGPLQGRSVTGGYVYAGPVESLRGQYFFGDFVTGNSWSIPVSQLALGSTVPSSQFIIRTTDFAPAQGAINNISSFGLDQSGNLFIVDFDGEIFRVEAL